MPLPSHIQEYLDSDEHKRGKAEFDAWCAKLDEVAAPVLEAVDGAWRKLEFTPEAMEIGRGDPDIAFQCEWEDWVIRADYSGEIGNSMWSWKKGEEALADEEWGPDEFFAHGTPGPLPTPAECEQFNWIMEAAIRSFAAQQLIPE